MPLVDKALQQRWRIPNIWLPTSLVLVKWIMRACERAVDHGHLHPHESCLGQRILYGTPANGVTAYPVAQDGLVALMKTPHWCCLRTSTWYRECGKAVGRIPT